MELVTAAQGFSAMGSESRLEVLQTLVRAGDKGMLVGDIQHVTTFAQFDAPVVGEYLDPYRPSVLRGLHLDANPSPLHL